MDYSVLSEPTNAKTISHILVLTSRRGHEVLELWYDWCIYMQNSVSWTKKSVREAGGGHS